MNTDERISEVEQSRIYRIIEGSVKEGTLNHDFLVDFIIKSIDNRFIFHKFINISFINFLKMKMKKKNRALYLEFMPTNLLFISKLFNQKTTLETKFTWTSDEKKSAEEEHELTKKEKEKLKKKSLKWKKNYYYITK